MAESQRVSSWIVRLKQGDRTAEDQLFGHFYALALGVARKRIGPAIQACVGPSDVANAAMKSLLSDIGHGRLRQDRREDAEYLLRYLVKKKVAKMAQRLASPGLAPPVTQPIEDLDPADTRELSPEDEAILRESVEEIADFLLEDEKRLRGIACFLGIVLQFPASAVRIWLEKLDYPGGAPALRTIEYWLKAAKERLTRRFGSEMAESG